jgi:hypothetical protein
MQHYYILRVVQASPELSQTLPVCVWKYFLEVFYVKGVMSYRLLPFIKWETILGAQKLLL